MARPLRIEYPGAYYHVINRGNAGENIFVTERDKEKFLEYLGNAENVHAQNMQVKEDKHGYGVCKAGVSP